MGWKFLLERKQKRELKYTKHFWGEGVVDYLRNSRFQLGREGVLKIKPREKRWMSVLAGSVKEWTNAPQPVLSNEPIALKKNNYRNWASERDKKYSSATHVAGNYLHCVAARPLSLHVRKCSLALSLRGDSMRGTWR